MAQRYHCMMSLNIISQNIVNISCTLWFQTTSTEHMSWFLLTPICILGSTQGHKLMICGNVDDVSPVQISTDAHLMSITSELECSREATLNDPPHKRSGHDWISLISTHICTVVGILLQDAKRLYVRRNVPVKTTRHSVCTWCGTRQRHTGNESIAQGASLLSRPAREVI